MPVTMSPLRYPGGKSQLYPLIKSLIYVNKLHGTYIEPFAGGAGLALKLLFRKDVKRIVLNDSDYAIYTFWHAVLHQTEDICKFIETTPLTYEQWLSQKYIYLNQKKFSNLELAQATLFLNRTNVSGILKGGIIGGKNQNGKYKMSARFNRQTLINKIYTIAKYKKNIDLYNLDALHFLAPRIIKQYYNALINLDPPYVKKGSYLYLNYFKEEDHVNLYSAISKCKRKWVVTYDMCDFIYNLYQKFRWNTIDLTYGSTSKSHNKEYIFFSKNMILPDNKNIETGCTFISS